MAQCCERVFRNYHSNHCEGKVAAVRDGKSYCAAHDPVRRKARELKQTAKWEEESHQRGIRFAGPDMLALLVESQTSIDGDWRQRRDAIIERLKPKKAEE